MLPINRICTYMLLSMGIFSIQVQADPQWSVQHNGVAKAQLKTQYSNEIIHDPTKPAHYAAPTARRNYSGKKLVLNSIVVTSNRSYAVINNQIYHRGEKVQGIGISQITHDHVRLSNGRKLTLFKSVN